MEWPWDVLTEVARHLGGRARPVCRAFTEDQQRLREALRKLIVGSAGEATVGQLWPVRVWKESDGTVSLGCEAVPYAALRRALMCAPPSTGVFDGQRQVPRSEWEDPQHDPDITLSDLPPRAAAAFLTNVGEVHRLTAQLSVSRSVLDLPAPTSGAWETLEVPVIARNRLRKLGVSVPPAVTRLPSGAWFRGTTQVRRPDLQELLSPLRVLPPQWRHVRHVVRLTTTLLHDSGSLLGMSRKRCQLSAAPPSC